jgi:four helix bundle protein
MATIKSLEDFKSWQKARLLNTEISGITNAISFNQHFDLKMQMRSSSLSVVANLAEGYARQGNKEFFQYLSISKSSLIEVKSHLYSCLDLKLIKRSDVTHSFRLISDIQNMTSKLMDHIKSSPLKGTKYKYLSRNLRPELIFVLSFELF